MSFMDFFRDKTKPRSEPPSYIGYELDFAHNAAGFFFKSTEGVKIIRMPLEKIVPIMRLEARAPVEIEKGGYFVPPDDIKFTGRNLILAQKNGQYKKIEAAPS